MKIYLCGQKYFGQEVYRLISGMGHTLVGVCAPAYRDERISLARGGPGDRADRLRQAAAADGVPWLEAGNLRAAALPAGVDLIVAAHSYDFIGRATRNASKLGAIGYHPSLLPLHRGRDAVRWAVKLGERVTGGTVYWLNDTVDGGPVAAQEHVLIDPAWDAAALWRKALQPLGLGLLRRAITDIGNGVLVRVPQDQRLATWEPKLDAPPLFRPELLQIGAAWDGYTVVTTAAWAGAE